MERLTERCARGIKIKGCSTLYVDKERKGAPASNAIVRLADYEDAMPLERAQELVQAEKDGQLVVLPCKVGDIVYLIRDEKIIVATVETIHQWNSGVWKLNAHTDKRYTRWVGYEVFLDDFGKTVFLTREEAEAELERKIGGTQCM